MFSVTLKSYLTLYFILLYFNAKLFFTYFAGGQKNVWVSSPDNAGGDIPVGFEGGEGQVGLPDVPHVDGEVDNQR